jgi:acyl-coenzyme A synthetase/AMP-(fatty) acid ligase
VRSWRSRPTAKPARTRLLFVVPAPGAPVAPEAIWRWCDRRLPYFAVPRYIRFVDALPKTPSEKVQKAKLREMGLSADTADRNADSKR